MVTGNPMARAYSIHDDSDLVSDPQPGQWQALRGELVALLDQVEGRYARVEEPEPEPALAGLTAETDANEVAIRTAPGAASRLARPRTAFCSCRIVGTPARCASSTVGTEG